MPAGHGLRSRTRDLFSRPFRKKGTIHLSTYLRTYHTGDYVDIKVNGAVHKGMPHKFYHGRTGQVWNVTKRSIGVEMNKQIISVGVGHGLTLICRFTGYGGQRVSHAIVCETYWIAALAIYASTASMCCVSLNNVGNRIIKKRIHVRVEHVQPSRCTEDFKLRKKKNDELKAEAKSRGEVISTKRQPEGPKPGFMVEGATLETVTPIPYDVVNDLKGGY
ncbi:hypothetical protein RHSIM_Rhsim12G0127600 [Rhododendron simsii]|uniref:60S ribosomal protein L21 n=1 Tax=Rhododendron simsii TaxID=118357 RepID=A0A834G400_RHOSS|nr:hypothetical protein RHSIM_Rhsim12G0127600 [Rhododendron simsii]